MQLAPRYLVNERINVITNDAGFFVEYRPVYSRTLNVYKNIDNTISFRLLNADQKPVPITNGVPYIVIFDENQTKILERECTVTDDGSTTATRGMFQVTITETDMLDIKQQYLQYNIYMLNSNNTKTVTYAGRNFSSAGRIFLDAGAYPGPKGSIEITNFFAEGLYWVAGSDTEDKISAEPEINGATALHTVAIYNDGYAGNVEIQATLDNQLSMSSNWATVSTITLTGDETEPVPANFNGSFTFVRFKFNNDPTATITRILLRN
jgi:hypothetical protein